ncbi:MAG TPA: tRNA (adenosine(37)-N6)-threonylcarbamoyltransferase complex dimerization subunit type 1 TsaB [Polyangia bacterium]|nr:tRNA (adenosine(37)-N6)-threonylcarbamoyltransferase complex dimerization subunit type 1 TsaB [Polyangia bacterium]
MTATPLLLCLDTSTPTARVAIVDLDGQARFSAEITADRHAGHLMPLCAQALKAAGVAAAQLAGIACGGGPGSFTGLRVGLAAAKGMSMATGVPLHVVSSLQALAVDLLAATPAATAVPCLDAGKGEVYVAAYAADPARLARELLPSARLQPQEVAGWATSLSALQVAGNGAVRHRERLAGLPVVDVAGPTALSVGRLALLQRARGEAADLASVVPFYGRPPDITVSKKGP